MERQAGVKAVTFILSVLSELPDTAVNWSSSVPAQSVPALCSPFTGSHTLIYSAVSTPVLMIQAPFWQLSSCRHNPASVLFFFLSSHTYTPHDHSVRLQWVKEEQQPALDKSTQCAHGLVLWICPHLPLDQHSLLHNAPQHNKSKQCSKSSKYIFMGSTCPGKHGTLVTGMRSSGKGVSSHYIVSHYCFCNYSYYYLLYPMSFVFYY